MKISKLGFHYVVTKFREYIIPTNSMPNGSVGHVPKLLLFFLGLKIHWECEFVEITRKVINMMRRARITLEINVET